MCNIENNNLINRDNQFIYCNDKNKRKEYLMSIEKDNPIVMNSQTPIVVYTNDFSLDKEKKLHFDRNYMLSKISSEHLNFSLLKSTIEKILSQDDLKISLEKAKDFLRFIEKISFDKELKLSSLEELLDYLKESCYFYKEYYNDFVRKESTKKDILDLKLSNVTYESMIYKIKKMLNNSSYFVLVFDKQKDISVNTARSINNLILNRNSNDLSIKVACEEKSWPTYSNQNDIKILEGIDFESVKLSDKGIQYIKKR